MATMSETESESSTLMTSKKRNRQTNYSPSEISLIADEVGVRQRILFGPFTSTVTTTAKLREWDEIATKLNACSSVRRTGTQIRKKWNDYKSQVKKKAIDVRRESSKTGGGPAPGSLSDLENKVVSLIPQCQIEGIVGGLESEVVEAICTIEAENAALEETFDAEPMPWDEQESTSTAGLMSSLSSGSQHHEGHKRPQMTENAKSRKKAVASRKQQISETTENQQGQEMAELIKAENEKSAVLKELLEVQRKMLAVSERRLEIESQRLNLEKEKFQFKKQILSIPEDKSLSPVIKFLHEF